MRAVLLRAAAGAPLRSRWGQLLGSRFFGGICESASLAHLIAITAERSWPLWRDNECLAWLERCAKEASPSLGRSLSE